MAMSRHNQPQQPPPQPPLPAHFELEITIHSGKHLKNVNWKNGDLKPYAIFWVDRDHKLTTKSDDSGNTKPVWNQSFTLSLPTSSPLSDAVFSLEIFHSKASETPKPFVGSLQVRLSTLTDPNNVSKLRSYDLLRPSGRPQGKIKLKLALKEHLLPPPPPPPQHHHQTLGGSEYQNGPPLPTNYYYSSAPLYPYTSRSASPAPPPAYPYTMGYYSGYYPPSPSMGRSFSERNMSYGAPSAPADYSPYELRSRGAGGGPGLGTGLAAAAVAGVLGGLALDEGLKYEEEKIAERVEDNVNNHYLSSSKDDFSEYRADY